MGELAPDVIPHNQVSVGATATLIVDRNYARRAVVLTIAEDSILDLYLGSASVTTSTGLLIVAGKGSSITIPTSAALYGIVTSGTLTISYLETE